ncbi:protein Mpv17 [Nematocida major]|uniref:protein Mpv17 n=1 Tax=Nematocida major TaxID=1912982 RepID=UPI0020087CEC|nr:protein Mpv17 [Nematocida major]KAH9387333.1 protein Mpv17 [Nematocida major]
MKINKRGIIEGRGKTRRTTPRDLFVQGGSTAIILALSDILGQIVTGRVTSYIQTPFLMGLYGFLTGNMCFLMYTQMEAYGGQAAEHLKGFSALRVKTALYKMLFDQFVWAPVGNFMFILIASLVDGSGFTVRRVLRDYFKILFDSYKIWPFLQMINFLFVPLEMRVTFIGVSSLIWNTYVKIVRQGKLE